MNAILWFIGGHGGTPTDLWGGILSCFVGASLLGTLWHGINCHEKGCWRPGHHVSGTVVCHKHRKPPEGT